jgi:hypothetical protein
MRIGEIERVGEREIPMPALTPPPPPGPVAPRPPAPSPERVPHSPRSAVTKSRRRCAPTSSGVAWAAGGGGVPRPLALRVLAKLLHPLMSIQCAVDVQSTP